MCDCHSLAVRVIVPMEPGLYLTLQCDSRSRQQSGLLPGRAVVTGLTLATGNDSCPSLKRAQAFCMMPDLSTYDC